MDDRATIPGQNATGGKESPRGFAPGTLEPYAARLAALHPWTDMEAVTTFLAEWVGDYRGDGSTDGPRSVARVLATLGREPAFRDGLTAASVTYHMLANVAAGREALDYGNLAWHIEGLHERTLRRWRHEYDNAQVVRLLQHDLDVAAERRRGAPTKGAARKRVQRRRQG